MNDFFEKLKTVSQEARFEPEQKQRVRNRLIQIMLEQPVEVRRPWWSVRWVQVAMACLLVVIAGGATSVYAANRALPGEILYSIKIRVNEPIVAALQRTPEQKAAYEIQRASTRLEEVDQLALDQKLDDNTRQTAEANFNLHVSAAQQKIGEIEASGDIGAATELDSGLTAVLNAHEKVLDSLQQRPASNHQELDQIQQNVRAALKRGNRRSSGNSENSSDDQNQQVGADQSAAVSADTQQAKSEAQDILRRATDALNSVPDSRRQENNGLQGAVELLAKANAAYNSGDYARSVSLAKAVLTMVQENNVLDGVNSRLNLDVQTNEGHDDGH